MNKNEESLIKHALKLYGVQYNDNIELRHGKYIISNKEYIEVGDRNILDSYILRIFSGTIDMRIYKSRSTSLNLDINIRSFINHWIQYYNFNKTINRVAVRKCSHNRFYIIILCNDDCWYWVLSSPRLWVYDWIVYNW